MTKMHTFGPSQCVKLNFGTNVIQCHFTHTSRHPFINTRYIIIIISVSDESCSTAAIITLLIVPFQSSTLRP